MSWNDYPLLSDPLSFLLILIAAVMLAYWARRPVHEVLRKLGDLWYAQFRFASRALTRAHRQLQQRNRVVILELGQQRLESRLEGELTTLAMILARDWDAHPALHRKLEEQLEAIAKDYRESAQPAPQPPPWISTLDALLRSGGRDQAVVTEIAQAMHATLERSQTQAVAAYRNATRKRQRTLALVVGRLRHLDVSAQRLERKVADLESRLGALARSLDTFRDVAAGRDNAARSLAASFGVQFLTATLVLAVAALVGYTSFHLIVSSLSDLVEAEGVVGLVSTVELAAFSLVALQVVAGLIAAETLGATRLLGTLQRMEPTIKQRLAWSSVAVVGVLAAMQAALAYMHDPSATSAKDTLAFSAQPYAPLVHMTLGFILAIVLAATSIALDAFFYAGRAVLGLVLDPLLAALAAAMFLIAHMGRGLGRVLRSLYDVVIFLPLAIERWWRTRGTHPEPFGKPAVAQPQAAGVVDSLDFSSFTWGEEPHSPGEPASQRGNSLPPPPLQ